MHLNFCGKCCNTARDLTFGFCSAVPVIILRHKRERERERERKREKEKKRKREGEKDEINDEDR